MEKIPGQEIEIFLVERASGFNNPELKWLAYMPELGNDDVVSGMWSEGKTKGTAIANFMDAYDAHLPFTFKFTTRKI